jgi:hypothetical protein
MVKEWSFGGFGAKLVKRKTDTLPTSEGEEERAEKERGEELGVGRGEGRIPHKDFSPKQNHINQLSR